MKSRFLNATFLQFMGIVGSGIFVLPYLFYHSNFIFACTSLIFLIVVTAVLNQFYVKIVTHTKGDHQLAGYASIYLGPHFRLLAIINLLFLSFGAIIAYTKLFVSFFILIFPSLPSFIATIFFLLILSFIFFYRQRHNHNLFIIVPVFMFLVPILLFIFSFSYPTLVIGHTVPNFSFFGAALFALSGFTIIPEVQEILGFGPNPRRRLSRAVLSGLLLAALSYFLYIYSVVVISGPFLSVDSVTGLVAALPLFSKIMAIFGMIVILRASYNFLIILRELFYRDLKITRSLSDILPLLFPVIAFGLGSISLLTVISLTGHITIFISALLICLISLKIKSNLSTQFFSLLVMITLSLGLLVNI